MENEKKVDGASRRKFIKIAAATAYVAPLIASMPAQATYGHTGSKTVKKKVWKKSVYRKKAYKKYNRYRSYNRYKKYNRYRRW